MNDEHALPKAVFAAFQQVYHYGYLCRNAAKFELTDDDAIVAASLALWYFNLASAWVHPTLQRTLWIELQLLKYEIRSLQG